MRKRFFGIILGMLISPMLCADGLDTLKGVWSSVESFPLFTSSFWSGIGKSFGGSPTGYVYNYDVVNDANQTMYVGVQEYSSFMGGDFPKSGGWNVTSIAPFGSLKPKTKEYYFEILIKTTPKSYSSHMPYMPHDDVLYTHDAIQLNEKHSTHLNYFRIYIGKQLQNGSYVHVPKAEYLGYSNTNAAAAKKDAGSVQFGSALTSLTIQNSTITDYWVGYVNQAGATTMTKSTCQVYAKVAANSFGILSLFGLITSLRPGTIGIFDDKSTLISTYNLHTNGFEEMPYTLEIYKDGTDTGPQMAMQGLMSGNYDQPCSLVRDITPITCVLWYQNVQSLPTANQQGYVDLKPGKVWPVMVSGQVQILGGATPGQAAQFTIMRPDLGQKSWLYFVYVDTPDDAQAQQFIQNLFSGSFASSTIQNYKTQAAAQMQAASSFKAATTATTTAPDADQKTLLIEAIQGVLQLNGGQVIDPVSGVAGYLLGGDVFLPRGTGMQPLYYVLSPSQSNLAKKLLPTATVQNMYTTTLSTTAPSSMPTPAPIKGVSQIPAVLVATSPVTSPATSPVTSPTTSPTTT